MKKASGWFYCFLVSFSVMALAGEPVKTVENLNIDAYMGKWHEVAAIPAWFQRKCVGETTAEYERNEIGITVTNKCIQKDGSVKIAQALGRINKKFGQNSKLQVTFTQFLGTWFWWFSGNYWVMDVDEKVYSVVGEPSRDYLWILSRVPQMDLDGFKKIEKRIREQHYDTCQIKITQEGDMKGQTLCSIVQ